MATGLEIKADGTDPWTASLRKKSQPGYGPIVILNCDHSFPKARDTQEIIAKTWKWENSTAGITITFWKRILEANNHESDCNEDDFTKNMKKKVCGENRVKREESQSRPLPAAPGEWWELVRSLMLRRPSASPGEPGPGWQITASPWSRGPRRGVTWTWEGPHGVWSTWRWNSTSSATPDESVAVEGGGLRYEALRGSGTDVSGASWTRDGAGVVTWRSLGPGEGLFSNVEPNTRSFSNVESNSRSKRSIQLKHGASSSKNLPVTTKITKRDVKKEKISPIFISDLFKQRKKRQFDYTSGTSYSKSLTTVSYDTIPTGNINEGGFDTRMILDEHVTEVSRSIAGDMDQIEIGHASTSPSGADSARVVRRGRRDNDRGRSQRLRRAANVANELDSSESDEAVNARGAGVRAGRNWLQWLLELLEGLARGTRGPKRGTRGEELDVSA